MPQTDKPRDRAAQGQPVDKAVIFACGRLKNARTWFTQHHDWIMLPQTERGRRILQWGADHAWMANPANPKRGVRRWCRCWAPWLSDSELDQLIKATETSNKRWSHDQSAAVLEISVRDRIRYDLRFFGACDDDDGSIREELRKTKAREKKRRQRARCRKPGAKRGRPGLKLSPEEKRARSNAQAAARMQAMRMLRKNASPHISTIERGTEFSVTEITMVEGVNITLPAFLADIQIRKCRPWDTRGRA